MRCALWRKPDKPIRQRVQTAINRLGEQPQPRGVTALRGLRGAYRLRVGDYQVVYTVEDRQLVILLVDLGHRREIYRDL